MSTAVDSESESDGERVKLRRRGPVETPPGSGNMRSGDRRSDSNDQPVVHFAPNVSSPAAVEVASQQSVVANNSNTTRFTFVSDTRAPLQLSRLEEETLRRRSEFHSRVREIDIRMAALSAKLANEVMDREQDAAPSLSFDGLLQRVITRFEDRLSAPFIIRKGDTQTQHHAEPNLSLLQLEARVAHISSLLLHHTHVSVYNARRTHLDSSLLRETLQLPLERAKADKREGGMVRKFESLVGLASRSYSEENASRIAHLDLLHSQERTIHNTETDRTALFLQQIANIRRDLDTERKERQERDKQILNRIIETRSILEQIVLESLGSES